MSASKRVENKRHYWLLAFFFGTLLNCALFLILPALGRSNPPPPVPVITLMFSQWQEPVKTNTPPEKVTKPKPKHAPPKKPKPPVPKPKPKPVVQELSKEQAEPKPVEKVVKPVLSESEQNPENVVQKPAEPQVSESTEDSLPTPVPLFELTNMPRFIHKQEPIYPPLMRSLNREGTVKVKVLIDEKGNVRKVYLMQSLGDAFDKSAMDAMMHSKFEPGNINGKAVSVLLIIPVVFSLH